MTVQEKIDSFRNALAIGFTLAILVSGIVIYSVTDALNTVSDSVDQFGFYPFKQIQGTLMDATRLRDSLNAAAAAPDAPKIIDHLDETNDLAHVRFMSYDSRRLFFDLPRYRQIFAGVEQVIDAVDAQLLKGATLDSAALTSIASELDGLLNDMNELYFAYGNSVDVGVENTDMQLQQLGVGIKLVLGLFSMLVIGAVILVAKRQESSVMLKHQASHDSLTDLKNRSWLHQNNEAMFDTAHVQDKLLMLSLIDLDRFKQVNDTYGHHVGDGVLVYVANQLKQIEQGRDISVVRLGGDELAMLAIVDDAAAVTQLQNDMQRALNVTVMIAGVQLHLGASIGIALYPEHGGEIDTLMHNADLALYAAKDAGRGRSMRYEAQSMNSYADTPTAVGRMRTALENGEFELYWQPIFNLHSGQLAGAEAVLRWNDSKTGEVIRAKDFIHQAEKSGVIYDIDQMVVAKVCAAGAAWEAEFESDFVISMNISPLHLRGGGFPEYLSGLAAKCGMSPKLLEVDITAETLLADRELAFEAVRDLRKLGFRVALDDFGYGSADLQYLSELDIDRLKIHGSFTADIETSEKKRALIASIIVAGKDLGVEVIAEGVETQAQMEFLIQHDCDLAQGFLLAKPAQSVAFGKYLRRNMTRKSDKAKVSGASAA